MTSNGKVKEAEARQAIERSPWKPKMYRLTSDELSPRDLKRAKVMLDGRNPWEVLDDDEDRLTLIMWCLKSRHIPGFTWEQAEETTYGEFLPPTEVPPPTPASDSSGSSKTTPAGNASDETPQPTMPERDSAHSST